MRVVSWNVQHGRPNPDGPPDIARVVQGLRPLDADVVAIQELDRGRSRSGRRDQAAAVADGLDGTLVWAPTVQQGGQYGVALVVRGEVVRSREMPLGGTREPRVLLLAEVDHGGRRWTIGCTHLSRRAPMARRQLLVALDVLATQPPPRVLMGDLNLAPAEVLPWTTAAGFRLVAGPPTHSTRKREPTRRIDHIVLSGARATHSAVHRFPVSDHCAVSATLE